MKLRRALSPTALLLFVALTACGDSSSGGTETSEGSTSGDAMTEGAASSTTGSTTTSPGSTTADSTGPDATTEGPSAEPDLLGDKLLNIAHRGGAREFPEHTLVAYEGCLAAGSHVLELDVHRTQDDVLVVMHDDTVDRTTDGAGAIVDMTLAELKELDAGYNFSTDGGQSYPYRDQGVTVPTVEEVFTAFPDELYVIELKPSDPGLIAPLLAALDDHGLRERAVLASFHDGVVYQLRADAPDVHTAMTLGEVVEFIALTPETIEGYEPPARFLQVPIEYQGITVITPERVAMADQLGLKIHAWTINDEAEMQTLIDWSVHGIMTDYPSRLAGVLGD